MRRIRGGDATQKGDFPIRKQRLQGSKFFSDFILSTRRIFRGGDATENRDFQREKQRLQGSKNFQISFYLHQECSGGRRDRKSRFSKRETAFAG